MSQRKEAVVEYMRRGKRIAPAQLPLMEEEHCHAQLVELWTKIEMVRNVCSSVSSAEELWKVIALCEVFAENQKERLSPRRLIRYLQNRYCGEKLDWNDIHLQAQTEAVLYSFKILNDITAVALPKLDEGKMKEAATACLEHLRDLPPIQAVSTARLERPLAQKAAGHITTILDSMEETASDDEDGDEEMPDAVEWELPKVSKKAAKENNPPAKGNSSKKPVNLFELLQSG
ncbi:hypothetical protein KEM55_007626 [Ascosphaera atra]|nr:hypothetical protein KEM55_007626 [Ascosphaera atra]